MQLVSYYNLVLEEEVGRKGGDMDKRTSKDIKQQTAIIVPSETASWGEFAILLLT
jgi:hypothetical protein